MAVTSITVHKEDNDSEEAKINTTNLGLKSLYGNEKRRYLETKTTISLSNSYLAESNKNLNTLNNIVYNLTVAATRLINLDKKILSAVGRAIPEE